MDSTYVGELELVRADKKSVCWQFPGTSPAEEVRDEIHAWLEEHSQYPLPVIGLIEDVQRR